MVGSQRVYKKRKNPWKKSENKQICVDSNFDVSLGLESSPSCSLQTVSASKSKLRQHIDSYENFNSDCVYDIVDLENVMNKVLSLSVCKQCHSQLQFSVSKRIGLACNFVIKCSFCEIEEHCFSSPKVDQTENIDHIKDLYDVNLRYIYGLRSIGKGQRGGEMLCAVMNLPKPPTKFDRYVAILTLSIRQVAVESMQEAVEESVKKKDGIRDLCIGLDGTWQKRGHVSLNGVITCTSMETGHVIDIDIFSKHCLCPRRNEVRHETTCQANYTGTSGGMEVTGAKNIFRRSEDSYNARYLTYLGDGDSKGFEAVSKEGIYGDIKITKLECIGHVQKRMGTRLRKLKVKFGKNKLSDGKPISGKGRRTDVAINNIQEYYGLAIRRHTKGSLNDMQNYVWASYFLLCSTNEKPNHGLCPKGTRSWCKYQRAVATNETYDHNTHFHLPEAVMIETKQIYKDLANPALLQRCLHGKSQNQNESFNNVLWSRLPKNVFVSLETLKLGAYDAVSTFNKGIIAKCLVLKKLGLIVGKKSAETLRNRDIQRINKAEKKIQELHRKARQSATASKKKLEELYKEMDDPENPPYAAGGY